MIPPDYTDVSQESPRECCANLAMQFRALALESRRVEGGGRGNNGYWEVTEKGFTGWASRLERACRRLDAEKSPPEAGNVAGFVKYIEDTRWHSFPVSLKEFKEAAHNYAIQCAGAVSPAAPPAEHQEDQ